MNYFFMSGTLGLFLITACLPVHADYYGPGSPLRVHRYVDSSQYHARPGRHIHGHSESAAGRAIVIRPGNSPTAQVHGHAGSNQQALSARNVIIQPLERRRLAQNNPHGHY